MAKRIAILALQGAFREHEQMLRRLGVESFEIRQVSDIQKPFDGLILPGGESTVQSKLLQDLQLFEPLRKRIKEGLPVLATCAGLILLAARLAADPQDSAEPKTRFATMDISVQRNGYGRQLGSFRVEEEYAGLGRLPFSFIRAPYVTEAGPDVKVLASVNGRIVAVEEANQTALAFHPELDDNTAIHESFVRKL